MIPQHPSPHVGASPGPAPAWRVDAWQGNGQNGRGADFRCIAEQGQVWAEAAVHEMSATDPTHTDLKHIERPLPVGWTHGDRFFWKRSGLVPSGIVRPRRK